MDRLYILTTLVEMSKCVPSEVTTCPLTQYRYHILQLSFYKYCNHHSSYTSRYGDATSGYYTNGDRCNTDSERRDTHPQYSMTRSPKYRFMMKWTIMLSPLKTLKSIKNWMSTRWVTPSNMLQSSDTCLENRTSTGRIPD